MRITALAAAMLALSATAAAPSDNARFQFCWIGASGYTMEGIIGFPGDLLGTGIITQADLTEFRIWGYLDGVPVGSWSMQQRTTETSWTLFFDTNAIAFPMGGHFLEQSYQEWNANGQVDDCGKPGLRLQRRQLGAGFLHRQRLDRGKLHRPRHAAARVPMDEPLRCEAVLPLS
jgi:hypothetical protein